MASMATKGCRLWKTKHLTLRPPCHGGDPDADHPPDWVLLDVRAYIDDRQNGTTAITDLSNGHKIQVTFCAAPPPLVSYICAWSPTMDPAQLFEMEPTVEAVNADLVFLRIHVLPDELEDLVYQAKGRVPSPSLTLIHKQDPYLLLGRYGIALIPRSGNGHGFYISKLDMDLDNGIGQYNLCLFYSINDKWSHEPLSLDQLRNPPDKNEVLHITEKVITLKDQQLVAFVDLWRGIVICDIFDSKTASYVPLPKEIINLNRTRGSSITRDIAVIKDRLTVARLGTVFDPEIKGWYWELSTWSRPVATCLDDEEEDWREDFMVESSSILIDDNTHNIELLPKLQDVPAIAKLYVANPTLSLTDPQVVYIMGSVDKSDEKAVLLSLDMATKRLQRVSVYDAERIVCGINVCFTQSTIFRYFDPASGLNGNLKRPGKFPVPYPRKQQAVNEPFLLDAGRGLETEDRDTMDWE